MRKSVAKVPVTDQNAKSSLTNAEAARFFGPTPLFFGEDQSQYEAIRDQISAAVGPLDFLEEIWVNDVVDLVWETLRLRRLKAALLQVAMHEGLAEILKPMLGGFGFSEAEDLAQSWCAREKAAVNKVNGLLAKAGLTMEAVKAQTLVLNLDDFERIERLIASAEARRDAALREVDRHRATLGAALQRAAEDIEDAEFAEIAPSAVKGDAA